MVSNTSDDLTKQPVTAEDADDFFRLVHEDRALLATYFPVTTGYTTHVHATSSYVRDLAAQATAK